MLECEREVLCGGVRWGVALCVVPVSLRHQIDEAMPYLAGDVTRGYRPTLDLTEEGAENPSKFQNHLKMTGWRGTPGVGQTCMCTGITHNDVKRGDKVTPFARCVKVG
jgi:hypothetical protein